MKFAENLRMFRKQRKWTQKDLADRVGVALTTISNYEQGIRTPDYETLEAIADTFNVSIDALMGKDESDNEIDGLLEYLKNREEGRLLFSTLKGATREDILRAAAIIDALRRSE